MRFYEFADFRIDAQERFLYQNGSPIPLAPKVFDTLFALVSRHGRVVSKDTLMEEIWQNTFVEENNLTQYIFTLRRVLGEKKKEAKFIETVSGRGYRFVPEVSVVEIEEEVWSPAWHKPGLPAENFIRSDSIRQPDKKPFENGVQNLDSIRTESFDSQTKPPKGGTPNFSLQAETQNIPAAPRPKSSSRAFLLFGLIALVIVGTLGFALRFEWQSKPSNSAEIKLKRLTESGNVSGAAISPDGNSLAYVLREGKIFSLRLKNIQTESEVVIIPPTEVQLGSPRFSPDGNFIYSTNRDGIFQIPVFGGESRQIASNIWSNFSVSPDGKQVAFPRSSMPGEDSLIVVANTDGSGERVVATRTTPDFYIGWGPAPVWSPDGEHITAATGRHGSGEMRLVEVNLQNGEERELKTQAVWENIEYLDWASTGELLMTAQKKGESKNQLWSVKFPDGATERVTNDFNDYIDFSLSGDKSKIAAGQQTENLHLWLFDTETGAARQITSGVNRSDGRFGLAFAPDGRIVFTARDKNNYEIYSVGADGGDLRQLTKNAGRRNIDAAVSPDNRFIAFASDRASSSAGEVRLWLMNVDGTEARRLTALSDGAEKSESSPYFSSDGRWIYYVFGENGKGSIRKISIDGGESVKVSQTDKSVYEPVPSPDGKFLAHAVYNDETTASPWQVAVMSLNDGNAPERYFNFSAFRLRVRWSLDSNSVVSIDDQSGRINLWQTNLTSGERQPITNFTTEKISRFDVSPDQRFYALARGNYFYDAVLIER
ncbi:MAG: winged helix-turn-helix domain-containing protein [Pyrinomonadaceae bacterium]